MLILIARHGMTFQTRTENIIEYFCKAFVSSFGTYIDGSCAVCHISLSFRGEGSFLGDFLGLNF